MTSQTVCSFFRCRSDRPCFEGCDDLAFAFSYLDVDHHEPTKAALQWLVDHTVPGGVILCDDFFQGATTLASKALNEFIRDMDPEAIRAETPGKSQLLLRLA